MPFQVLWNREDGNVAVFWAWIWRLVSWKGLSLAANSSCKDVYYSDNQGCFEQCLLETAVVYQYFVFKQKKLDVFFH